MGSPKFVHFKFTH